LRVIALLLVPAFFDADKLQTSSHNCGHAWTYRPTLYAAGRAV